MYDWCLCFCTWRPALLSSQSWTLQGQSQLLTASQPTVMSSVNVQLSRSHENLMQSTVPRPLTFSQQIRPQQHQQLAVITQKPELSSVTRHGGQYTLWRDVGVCVPFPVKQIKVNNCNIRYNAKYIPYKRNDEMTIYNDDDEHGNTVTTKLVRNV